MRHASSPEVVRFGIFELDVAAGELRKHGRRINLQQQPCQVLALLLRRPGELVTREELQQGLWPGDTFVEFDQGLNTAIKKIRQALGDSAENPRFVETLPRKGYRFVAPVIEKPDTATASPGSQFIRRPLRIAAALALAVVAAVAGWLLKRPGEAAKPAFVPLPLTTDVGSEGRPSFSPDGTQVVFDWQPAEGPSEIRVKRVGESESRRLAYGCCPAWSPDAHSIAYFSVPDGLSRLKPDTAGKVMLVSPLGGSPQELADLYPGDSASLAWDPRGKLLVVTDEDSPGGPTALSVLSVDTREKRRLTFPPSGSEDFFPAVSPDGAAVVFGRLFGGSSVVLYLLELTEDFAPNGEPKPLTAPGTYGNDPAWTPAGESIIYAAGNFHSSFLAEMPLIRPGWRPGETKRLSFAGESVRMPAISSTGALAYTTAICFADIWRLELKRPGQAAAPPEPWISTTRLDHVPQYSPDGKRIAFASNRSGDHEIWVSNSDGSGALKVTSMGSSLYTADPHWSPDGRLLLFRSNPGGHNGTYSVEANGGAAELLFPDTLLSLGARVGTWMYFDRQGQVFRRRWPPLREDPPVQLTRLGGYGGQESADGKTIYYAKDDNGGSTAIWKVPVDGGEETQVLPSVWWMNFVVAAEGIYFIPDWHAGEQPSIEFLNFATGKVNGVVALSQWPAYGFALSPDEHSLLFTQYHPWDGDLWMVKDYR